MPIASQIADQPNVNATQAVAKRTQLTTGEVEFFRSSGTTHGPERDHEQHDGACYEHHPDSLR